MRTIEKSLLIIEKVSNYLPTVVFIAGVIFIFLGFFDLRDLKSVEARLATAWGPVATGSVLVTIGLRLTMLRRPRSQRHPASTIRAGEVRDLTVGEKRILRALLDEEPKGRLIMH